MLKARGLLLILLLLVAGLADSPVAAGPRDYLTRPPEWFQSPNGKQVIERVLSHQSAAGSWPKNVDTTARRYVGDRKAISGTFDNGATTDELRLLARAIAATGDVPVRDGFNQGLDHILKAQYANGGWPQYYPPGGQYHRHITFNDGTLVRLLEFVREVATSDAFQFVDDARRAACQKAFERGIDCILRCQIKVGGKLTAWCAQHDEVDFQPRPGRTYELVSLSGSETVGIVRLLMSLEKPKPEVVAAVDAAVAWLQAAQLKGIRLSRQPEAALPKGYDLIVVEDPTASPLWARFYEIGTNKPIFCGRDGVRKDNLADIEYERRTGYAWLGNWPARLIERDYQAWKRRQAETSR